jgi:hypothetical protein
MLKTREKRECRRGGGVQGVAYAHVGRGGSGESGVSRVVSVLYRKWLVASIGGHRYCVE